MFLIYYGDGSVFCRDDGEWEDAPGWDVQVVLFPHPKTKWQMRHGADFFRLAEDGTVVGMDLVGMIDYVVNVLGVVKAGRMLTQAGFDVVYQRAKRDMAELKKA